MSTLPQNLLMHSEPMAMPPRTYHATDKNDCLDRFIPFREDLPHYIERFMPWTDFPTDCKNVSDVMGLDQNTPMGWSQDKRPMLDVLQYVGSMSLEDMPNTLVHELTLGHRVRWVPDDFFGELHKKLNKLGGLKLYLVDPSSYSAGLKAAQEKGQPYNIRSAPIAAVECYMIEPDGFVRTTDKIMMLPLIVKIFNAGFMYVPKNRFEWREKRAITHPHEMYDLETKVLDPSFWPEYQYELMEGYQPVCAHPECGKWGKHLHVDTHYCGDLCRGKHIKMICKETRHACAGGGCTNAGEMKCSKCKQVRYCGAECQKRDWCEHKRVCVPHAGFKPK